ncbi:hypothetical protein J1614_009623 [Plenodomus biglobosus]|nr:hypothetical protein J1614_009623 [Plenodomus biglobosus]
MKAISRLWKPICRAIRFLLSVQRSKVTLVECVAPGTLVASTSPSGPSSSSTSSSNLITCSTLNGLKLRKHINNV